METSNQNQSEVVDSKNTSYVEEIVEQCQSLLKYAIEKGEELENDQIALLSENTFKGSVDQLLSLYNYLVGIVKPANPKTIFLMEKSEMGSRWVRMLGPLPIVRQFTVLAILSLFTLILTSLSPDINVNTIQLSMLQGYGLEQVYRLMFLLACSSVGASFYALFKINGYLSKETFNVSLSHTYWNRYVLGLVAGLLLSELFVGFVNPGTDTSGYSDSTPMDSVGYLLKPILAILGGFSANLVYRVLNRLVGTIESLFKGEADDIIAQREYQYQLQSEENTGKLRNAAAQQLLTLKQSLVKANVSDEVLSQLDSTLNGIVQGNSQVVSKPVAPQAAS